MLAVKNLDGAGNIGAIRSTSFSKVPELELSSLDAPPITLGDATTSIEIQANIRDASGRNLGHCLCTVATISARMLAVGVGGSLYGAALFVNGVTTTVLYLPFVIPAVVMGSVGYAIDTCHG